MQYYLMSDNSTSDKILYGQILTKLYGAIDHHLFADDSLTE